MNAQDLFDYTRELHNNSTACGGTGPQLKDIEVNVREIEIDGEEEEYVGDTQKTIGIEEDLFDCHTNTILESIVIRTMRY